MSDLLMSDAPALALLAVFAVGLLAWLVAFALAVLALVHGLVRAYRWLRPRPRWVVDELALAEPDSVLWRSCHSTRCGHMQTRHTVTPEGVAICQGCGASAVSA
ncbi:hypothetical protein [Streptomyces niveus]|uniref:hypothetical protein n=1 Tax=Streptomyces niveus TaxID=193462 RepID=UPI0033B3C995